MKNIDDILKQALTPNDEPDFWLNERILSQSKEVKPMKKMSRKKFAAVALSCALMLGIGSISVYATWKYLMPKEFVEEIGEEKLADAFSGEDALYINETQSYGDYDVTLLGVTSGKNLTEYKCFSNENSVSTFDAANSDNPAEKLLEEGFVELDDRSYILFALENKKQAFEAISDFERLSIFPVVMGYDYETYSGMFEDASGGHAIIKDSVIYYMYECNNLEKYADHDIYMCVSDDLPSFSEYSYIYDNSSGMIARNEEYEGLNALFSLPMDSSKADPAAAEEAAKAHEAFRKARENETEEEHSGYMQEAFDFVEQITTENINEYATPLTDKDATKTFTPDSQGRVDIECDYYLCEFRTKLNVKKEFPEGTTAYISSSGISNGNLDTLFVELYTLNEDGTVTLQLYKPNLP